MQNNANRLYFYRARTAFWAALAGLFYLVTTNGYTQPICRTWREKVQFAKNLQEEISDQDLKNINPDYVLTVALLETGYGTGSIYNKTQNLFSIKAECRTSCNGPNGYRRYRSDIESIGDFIRLITTKQRYNKAYRLALNHQRKKFFQELQDSGYSESNEYAIRLERVFQEYKRQEIGK